MIIEIFIEIFLNHEVVELSCHAFGILPFLTKLFYNHNMPSVFNSFLFMPQRIDWIEVRRFFCRIPTKENPDC
jgi:hypothetical protein